MADRMSTTTKDFAFGWICALPLELRASMTMLDYKYFGAQLPRIPPCDTNRYVFGQIRGLNIVMACLPAGVTGTTAATKVAMQMRSTFQLRFALLVGIGGGAPSDAHDIRLGDVVVSQPQGNWPGVIKYDTGKLHADGRFEVRSVTNKPPDCLLQTMSLLHANLLDRPTGFLGYVDDVLERGRALKANFGPPPFETDRLYAPECEHDARNRISCEYCPRSAVVPRPAAHHKIVHFGLVASANRVMGDARTREQLRKQYNILCFEMEASGIVDVLPYLVIRGISDYADAHKNDAWQNFAALRAAALAKELLSTMSESTQDRTSRATIQQPLQASTPTSRLGIPSADSSRLCEKCGESRGRIFRWADGSHTHNSDRACYYARRPRMPRPGRPEVELDRGLRDS